MREKTLRERTRRFLDEVLPIPAVPFHEEGVAAYIRAFARDRGLRIRADRYGNLLVSIDRARGKVPPLVIAAHMDHPGFEVERMAGKGRAILRFYGGVDDRYFAGKAIEILPPEGDPIAGRVVSVRSRKGGYWRRVVATVRRPVRPFWMGVWKLEAFRRRGTRIHARACDDLGGVAATLAALDVLRDAPVRVCGLFTRAEEGGFHGAIAAAHAGTIPRDAVILAVETSAWKGMRARIGRGAVVRVGDRIAVFDPVVHHWVWSVAKDLAAGGDGSFQRDLLDGGTTEATYYLAAGFRAMGLSLPLGNYHNRKGEREIAPEIIDEEDAASLARLLVECAARIRELPRTFPTWRTKIERRSRKTFAKLRDVRAPLAQR
ncbi:MAG: M20/M25/M40 family metallo-hydrolase [Planctomycetes bacterium]|nr:M20/M25/M40 family metallo-hydrolase [Planctomycetota bacterium]